MYVYICMYVCMHVCMYVCKYVYPYVRDESNYLIQMGSYPRAYPQNNFPLFFLFFHLHSSLFSIPALPPLDQNYFCRIKGSAYQIEMMLTYAQITPFTNFSARTLELNCKCDGVKWATGMTTDITGCNNCQLSQFQGFDGLNIGMVIPVYGNIARFGDHISLTTLDPDLTTGYQNQFDSFSFILSRDPSVKECTPQPVQATLCGTYYDHCRGGQYNSLGFDLSNVARNWTFYGEAYGEFVYSHNLYNWQDTACTDASLFAEITVFGTFSSQGPSDCGGFCPVKTFFFIEPAGKFLHIPLPPALASFRFLSFNETSLPLTPFPNIMP